ncbi:MAG: leucine-rich repeat domain-containing protein, partial [Bacteroidaceae bacterium]|nr:leucine-rich repeat domain-containing protein [Bacteroidaceae bacterium]
SGTVSNFTGSATINLKLSSGNSYSAIFWAANENAPYTVNFTDKTMTVNYTNAVSNDETRDAFYKYQEFTVEGNQTVSVELKRPFAQLNIGTNDFDEATDASYAPTQSAVTVKEIANTLNLCDGTVSGEQDVTFGYDTIPAATEPFPVADYRYLAMNYVLVGKDKEVFDIVYMYRDNNNLEQTNAVGSVPMQRNYRTNIYGSLLTNDVKVEVDMEPDYDDDDKYGAIDGQVYVKVANIQEFNEAFVNEDIDIIILTEDIILDTPLTRAADPSLVVSVNKVLTIDLNGKKLSATSTESGKNFNMFVVHGTLTVKNGTMEYEHKGDNMAWNNSTNLFDVSNGGVLNIEDVTAKNLGGSDMAFVAHLNNWGEVTLNVNNSTLESTYVAVRVFNSGNDMNNVTIKNSTLKGNNYAFWVHNYTAADFGGSQDKADAQKKLLNLDIFQNGNTFSPDVNGIRLGMTDKITCDSYGITRSVSEDGTIVTLGSIVENGVVRRNVAGAERNSTITKVIVDDNITSLPDRTFYRYFALETVELPNTLTILGSVGEDYYSNGSVFQGCSKLKNIVIPESVITLGLGTFYGCTSLETINIPAGVTRIEKDAFRETGLVSVEFHENVTYFGEQAFRDCEALSEITINAPKFTVESNTFLNAAAPFPEMTIYVVNAEMKTYLESMLTQHQKTYMTIIAPSVVETADEMIEALLNGEDVVLGSDIKIDPANMSNAYGTTGINVTNGQTIDGGGHTLDIKGAGGTWDSGINTTGGLIKNIIVTGSFRGIFINHNSTHSETVVLENVIIDGTTYTISCDQGMNQNFEAYGSTFNGWTSYAATIGTAKFDGCSFGEGNGYSFCRPYAPTTFTNCDFEEGYEMDPCNKVSFINCRINGVQLTESNIGILVTNNAANVESVK